MKQILKKILKEMGWLGFVYKISYRLGLITMIPSTYIKDIPVCENGDILVKISSSDSDRIIVSCPEEGEVFVRKNVLNMLIVASSMLPPDLKLLVRYGYRSVCVQKKFWEDVCAEVKYNNPDLALQEVESLARKYSALPNGNGPHQTGGAVDVLIVDKNGNSLDFGSEYCAHNDATPMHTKSINTEQQKQRKQLRKIMQSVGFSYYPGEWWHHSFGDKMWAAYTGRKCALYGPAKI